MASETASLPLVSTYLPPRGFQVRFVFGVAGWSLFRDPRLWAGFAILAVLSIGLALYGLVRSDPWWWMCLTVLPAVLVVLYIGGVVLGLRVALRGGLYRDGREWRLTLESERLLLIVGEHLTVMPLAELTKVQTGFGMVMLTMLGVVPVALPRQAVSREILERLRIRITAAAATPAN